MKKIILKISVFLALFSTIGCAPVYYKPNLMNVPNFKAKDEAFAVVHLSDNGLDAEVAYAVTDNIGIQANHMNYLKPRPNDGSGQNKPNDYIGKGYLSEGAIGYFSPLSKICVMGLYGGYGVGNVKNNWQIQGTSSADFQKWFIQPSLGLKGRYVELIFAAKLGQLKYYNLNQSYTKLDFQDEFEKLKSPMRFAETSYTLRFGFENIKFQLQASTLNYFDTKLAGTSYEPWTLGLGLCFQLNTKKSFN